MVFAISIIPFYKQRKSQGGSGDLEIIGETQFKGIFENIDDLGYRSALQFRQVTNADQQSNVLMNKYYRNEEEEGTCSTVTLRAGLSFVPFASLILVSRVAKIPVSNSFLHSPTTPPRILPTMRLPEL